MGIWGTVNRGDEMYYIPNHQLFAGIGLEHQRFPINVNGRYREESRTIAGIGDIPDNERIDSNFIIDLAENTTLANILVYPGIL